MSWLCNHITTEENVNGRMRPRIRPLHGKLSDVCCERAPNAEEQQRAIEKPLEYGADIRETDKNGVTPLSPCGVLSKSGNFDTRVSRSPPGSHTRKTLLGTLRRSHSLSER